MSTPLPPIRRWDKVPNPVATVHILHGMSEHSERYKRFADELNAAGFVAWAHDHRGHGRNPTAPVGLGHFADKNGWRKLIDDAWAVSTALQAAYPSIPRLLVGHSMGSFVAQSLMAEHGAGYKAVVLLGTNGPPSVEERALQRLAKLERAIRKEHGQARAVWVDRVVFDRYNETFKPNRTRFDWLSRDPKEVDAYVADSLCGFALTTQSWVDFLEGRKRLGSKSYLSKIPKDLRVHVMAGSGDPVGEMSEGVKRLLATFVEVGLRRVSSQVYDGARHELLNETNRHEVTQDLIGWLKTAL